MERRPRFRSYEVTAGSRSATAGPQQDELCHGLSRARRFTPVSPHAMLRRWARTCLRRPAASRRDAERRMPVLYDPTLSYGSSPVPGDDRNERTAPGPIGLWGRYVVLGQIGAGSMGIVLAAHDPALDRKVALKVLRPRDDRSASAD